MALTDVTIRNAKPGGKPVKMADGSGMFLLVTPAGGKLWRLKYRMDGREKLLAIGAYPDISLSDARRRRDEARALIAKGKDPSREKQRDKVRSRLQAADTFTALAKEYCTKRRKDGEKGWAPATATRSEYLLSLLDSGIGHLPIADIEPADILAAIRRIENKGNLESARRTLQLAGAVFRYAVATARLRSDPTRDLRGALTAPKVTHYGAITEAGRVGALLRAIDGYEGQGFTKLAMQVAPHVFVRPGELRHAEWGEFDLDNAIWIIPAGKMKMRKPHHVPLSRQAVELFRELHSLSGPTGYVFPSIRSRFRPMSENTINAGLRRLGYSSEEMTAHGFRAMASTLLNESGKWHPDAIERALAHGDSDKVRAAYHRGAHWAERVEMAQWWSDYLEQLRKALAALDAWLERLAACKQEADEIAALFANRPHLKPAIPDFAAEAWAKLAADKGVPGGRTFSPRLSGDGQPVPNVTLKVPTGGGKTYLACAALSRIFGRYVGANHGMVLWIVPNEAIYTQTLKALRDRDHAYRQTLDRASANRTIILEKGDPLNAADLAANLCIMVLMLQSSNRENQDSLRLFRDRGDVHGFVPADGEQGLHADLLARVPNLSIYDLGDGASPWPMVKASMGNAMRIVRPVVVMDEGQRAVSDLAFSTLYGFNPRLVLELSATPKDVADRPNRPGRRANILCEISGRELENEGMIKMPMNVAPLPAGEWQGTLQAAWAKLVDLERAAREYEGDGGRYIRPILLVQVERTGAEQADSGFIHANDARDWLKGVAGLEDDQIAFKTAETNDLDKPENRDLLSRKSPVRAIITKAALAEGWDCPFAYVLCALAANGNESAMTQLVGRILRQPYADKTGVAALDECYVFAHRADTAATVAAIKKGLENDGLGDLARDVHLANPDGGVAGGALRPVQRREGFKALRIALPRVLVAEKGQPLRELDAESDLFLLVDWSVFDVAALAERLPKDARPPDNQFMRLAAGEHGVETVSATVLASEAAFDAAYAVRSIADLVPNHFVAWDIVIALVRGLRERGWNDALIGRLSAFLIAELRVDLAAEQDRQAQALFATGLESGTIRFGLSGGDSDWLAPSEVWTTLPPDSPQLSASNGGPLERSLFLPIYTGELNDAERKFAVYLDRDDAVRWWHRNEPRGRNYALRGWRRGNVYPDFLFAALQDGQRDLIVVIETKGEQLAGNADTEYKRALLDQLTAAFDAHPISHKAGLNLAAAPFRFTAALVAFSEAETKLPGIIRARTIEEAREGRSGS